MTNAHDTTLHRRKRGRRNATVAAWRKPKLDRNIFRETVMKPEPRQWKHCEYCGSDEAAEPDIRWYDLMDNAGLILPLERIKERSIRMKKRLAVMILEWTRNPERPYFAREFINGLDDDTPPERSE